MARTQSADYAIRREAIVEAAAELFAERGFLGASIADLAEALKTSKSLIYHYYDSKEDILFDVMRSHVQALLEAAEAISASPLAPEERLRALTRAFVALYVDAAARQRVLLNELSRLPDEQRKIVVGIQRRLIEIVEKIIAELRPELSGRAALKRPSAMLYFGMINWMHTWLDPQGRARPERIAELAADSFLNGFIAADLS
jgi:AcrR family transcriptional regulator